MTILQPLLSTPQKHMAPSPALLSLHESDPDMPALEEEENEEYPGAVLEVAMDNFLPSDSY